MVSSYIAFNLSIRTSIVNHQGPSMWHIVVDIVAVYSVLSLLGGTKLSLFLTWIMTMV